MYYKTPVNQLIQSRISCRTYELKPISAEILEELHLFINHLNQNVKSKIRFTFTTMVNDQKKDQIKYGIYGAISGAREFIVAIYDETNGDPLELGFLFETIILKATELGLGTCWLGGTFNRKDFEDKFNLNDHEAIPIVSPIGYAKDQRSFLDSAMRFGGRLNQRKPWQDLFFEDDDQHPLTKIKAGIYSEVLDMVRVGPSASNKQPWRIIKVSNVFHFYLARTVGYATMMKYDLQMNDIGIAQCHFEFSAKASGCKGSWQQIEDHPQNKAWQYCVSWVSN